MKKSARLTKKQVFELENFIKADESSGKETKRARAVLLLDKNISEGIVQAATGYSRRRIYFCRHIYLAKGLEGIKDKRKKPKKYLLTRMQRQEIKANLSNEKPPAYGYKQGEWTTAILGDLIEARYAVRYKSKTSYYLLFKESRLSFHKPGQVYEKHDAKKTTQWKTETKPKLEEALREKGPVILAEDEMVLSSQTTFQKVWLPVGEYPKIEVSNTRNNRSIYGFLNIKTGEAHAYKKRASKHVYDS